VFVGVLVCRLFACVERMCWHCLNQATVLHAFQPDEPVGKLLDLAGFAMDDEHFKAGVMVKMRMTGGDYQMMEGVLQVGELFADAMGVVIVDERDGADDGDIGRAGLLADEAIADEVAECLRAICVSGVTDGTVKAVQKVGINGNSDAAQYTHACSCPTVEPDKDKSSANGLMLPRAELRLAGGTEMRLENLGELKQF
jgi:hypothetical protein